ncbi:hypothetical protein IAT38_006216 [Cryptococcus sp. DSM 104549]
MSTGKVQCPICSISVSEDDINLHLDLQCKGKAPTPSGSSTSVPQNPLRRTSASSQKAKAESSQMQSSPEVFEVPDDDDDVPVPASGKMPTAKPARRALGGDGEASVAPIFAMASSRKRKAPIVEEKPEVATKEVGGQAEKKPRPNPLVSAQPLAERSRPTSLSHYIGQADIVGPGSLLRARIEAGEGVGSCILWGPPGCGKTTLARLIAKTANAEFKELSATSSGTSDVRQIFEQAKNGLKLTGRRTVLMVDEIHRFNRAQQDLFLPYVEQGWVQLIGATTENPSFKVNGALLSRCQVFTLSSHTPESLRTILINALSLLSESQPLPRLPPALIPFLADVAGGDARQALNGLELALKVCQVPKQTTLQLEGGPTKAEDSAEQEKRDKELMEAVRKGLRKGYDRTGEERYDMISALHKCLRGSDGSAAMYWLARMITGGEDPIYIARRLVVVASEDVGLADNHALPLTQAMATYQACQVIGLPECRINLAHCVAYLAEAPKSTRSYKAYKKAVELAETPPLPGVPLQIRNAPTTLMKTLGYGKEYSYDPDFAHPVHNEYLPHTLAQHSTHSDTPKEHILKSAEEFQKEKKWDEGRLSEWEYKVNGGADWEGRFDERGVGAAGGKTYDEQGLGRDANGDWDGSVRPL